MSGAEAAAPPPRRSSTGHGDGGRYAPENLADALAVAPSWVKAHLQGTMEVDTGSYSVLLVEDDSQVVELARRAAAECCPEIGLIAVGGGNAVLDWLNDSIAKKEQMPHIILIDLNLPKLDGLAVLRTLRKHDAMRDIPIVAFSAEHTQADVLMSYQVGANSFMAKPADLVQFTGFFREQLAYWMQPRQRELAFASGKGAGSP